MSVCVVGCLSGALGWNLGSACGMAGRVRLAATATDGTLGTSGRGPTDRVPVDCLTLLWEHHTTLYFFDGNAESD